MNNPFPFTFIKSGWVNNHDIWDYLDKEDEFSQKNITKVFAKAMDEIKAAIHAEKATDLGIASQPNQITLKAMPIAHILNSFDENKNLFESIFNERKSLHNRFNNGYGYDYLTVLWRLLSSEQQQAMYCRISKHFIPNEREYLQNPKVSEFFNSSKGPLPLF